MPSKKKEKKEKKSIAFFAAVFLVLVIVVGAGVILFNPFSNYKYRVLYKDAEFVSNSVQPFQYVEELRSQESFIVSPLFLEGGNYNSYMNRSLILFTSVLTAKKKTVIVLIDVTNGESRLYCQTDEGNSSINKEISVEECQAVLEGKESVVIQVEFPDTSLEHSRAEFFDKKIVIRPKSFEDISNVSFAVLDSLYPDSEDIIGQTNAFIEGMD